MFIEAELAFNEGANDGYWRFQLRGKDGRWIKMGGTCFFEFRLPNDKNVYRAYGTFQGNIRRGWSIIRVGEGEKLAPGDYEIDSRQITAVKAVLKDKDATPATSKNDIVDAPKQIDEAVGQEADARQVVASTVGDLEVGDIVQQSTEAGLYGRIASVDHSGETTKLNVEWSDGTAFDMDLPKDQKIRVWNRDDIIPPGEEELQKRADEAKARVDAVKKQIEVVDAPNGEEPLTNKQLGALIKLYNNMDSAGPVDEDAKKALFDALQNKDSLTSAKAKELLEADYTEKPKVDYAAEKWGKNVALVDLDTLFKYMHVDRTDPGKQVAGYSDANIEALAKEMKEKGVYGLNQALVLEWDPKGGWAYLVEGNHRLAAAKKAGLTELPVAVYQGMELSGFKRQGIGAPLHLNDSPEFLPDIANPSRFRELENSVVNKKPEIVDAPKSEVKDPNLKPEMDGEDALSVIRDAAAKVAAEDGRFPVARSAEDIEAAAKKQYAGVYETLRTESPYLVNQFLTFDEFWGYAKKSLAAGTTTRYADSVDEIPELMKATNRIYARDVLGVDPDGLITFYRNSINGHADVAKAAAGYASLDKNMAFNYNSDKGNDGANGRYAIKAKPSEIRGLLGYSDAADEHGVVIGPDITAIPGRVERLGDLGWTPLNPLMDPKLTQTGTSGGSQFRHFSTASTFEFPVLDSNPFAQGETDKWSDFYAANGLEKGAIPSKYDEIYGEGAFERDFPGSSGVPRYDIARDLFTEKDGQFALDPIKFDGNFKGSNGSMVGTAGDGRDKALKFFEAVQQLSGDRFMSLRGHETKEHPGVGGIIGRDKLGNPIYDNNK